jgi:hypothetical protein
LEEETAADHAPVDCVDRGHAWEQKNRFGLLDLREFSYGSGFTG